MARSAPAGGSRRYRDDAEGVIGVRAKRGNRGNADHDDQGQHHRVFDRRRAIFLLQEPDRHRQQFPQHGFSSTDESPAALRRSEKQLTRLDGNEGFWRGWLSGIADLGISSVNGGHKRIIRTRGDPINTNQAISTRGCSKVSDGGNKFVHCERKKGTGTFIFDTRALVA